MSNGDLFYICGIALAISAVLISLVGLKVKSFPGRAFPLVILWFTVLIGAAATFSVLHAQDEEHHKEAEFEQAGEEFEEEGNDAAAGEAGAEGEAAAPGGEQAEGGSEAGGEPKGETTSGPGGTIALAADATDIAYDKASLSSKPGKVTIDFTNPSALEHDVAIEADGEEIAATEVIAESETSVSTELAPGTYTFFCTVPGHREAGMEGELSVE
ncbi:MAG: plastocyanin/azurin family copper-binding protein [Solirubrobacterales bacterium]